MDARFHERLAKASVVLLTPSPSANIELQEILREMLRSLPEDQQTIYKMSREQEMTCQQIADELDISVKAVEKKMSHSLKHLRAIVAESFKFIILFFIISRQRSSLRRVFAFFQTHSRISLPRTMFMVYVKSCGLFNCL